MDYLTSAEVAENGIYHSEESLYTVKREELMVRS